MVLRLSVGGAKPGISPSAFEKKMKKAQVPISGRKNFAAFLPMMSAIIVVDRADEELDEGADGETILGHDRVLRVLHLAVGDETEQR